ncbi:MAG: tail fiber domain-containing protein [Saprospiraceae bacterium]|nr:tail fiber domain-containing protein [Saprospiraceae bacterium]
MKKLTFLIMLAAFTFMANAQIKIHPSNGISIGGTVLADPGTGNIQLHDSWKVASTTADLKFFTANGYLKLTSTSGANLILDSDRPTIEFLKPIKTTTALGFGNSWNLEPSSSSIFTFDGSYGDLTINASSGQNLKLDSDRPIIEFLKPIKTTTSLGFSNNWNLVSASNTNLTIDGYYGDITLSASTSDYFDIGTNKTFIGFTKPIRIESLEFKGSTNSTYANLTMSSNSTGFQFNTDKGFIRFGKSVDINGFKFESEGMYTGYMTMNTGPTPYYTFNTDKTYFQFNKSLRVNGSVNLTSDISLKENVIKLKDLGSSLDKLITLDGISYNLIADELKTKHTGFSAQDVQKLFPELIEGEEGDLSLDYIGLIPHLVEAIKEQQAEIDELKKSLKILLLEPIK